MRIKELPAPITASKADWLSGTSGKALTGASMRVAMSRLKAKLTIHRQNERLIEGWTDRLIGGSLDDRIVSGAAEGTRTPDPIITNDVLYHLSYSGPVEVAVT